MDVMSSHAQIKQKSKFSALLTQIKHDFPDIKFVSDQSFYWSASDQTIHYCSTAENPAWSLLHELGHMTHNHTSYNSDLRLVSIEVEAWDAAMTLAKKYDLSINEEYVQDCLDSYRKWQHDRSKCPKCSMAGLEVKNGDYRCFNCQNQWRVTPNRFCRSYRQTKKSSK